MERLVRAIAGERVRDSGGLNQVGGWGGDETSEIMSASETCQAHSLLLDPPWLVLLTRLHCTHCSTSCRSLPNYHILGGLPWERSPLTQCLVPPLSLYLLYFTHTLYHPLFLYFIDVFLSSTSPTKRSTPSGQRFCCTHCCITSL